MDHPFYSYTSGTPSEEKYIVYKSSLWELFSSCPLCNNQCSVEERYRKGTKIAILQTCLTCEYTRDWSSQPSIGDFPAGNIELSGAIQLCGASPTKVIRVLKLLNVATICERTFTNYLNPLGFGKFPVSFPVVNL